MIKTHRINQGDDGTFKLPLCYAGQPTPVEGWQLWFTVKRLPADPDADALFQLSTAAGTITAFDATTFVATVPALATHEQTPGRYYFDLQGRQPGGGIITLETGVFIIEPAVTAAA